MFRKIVSNLPFSPALVGQLSFYAKRLRKEEATRKTALVLTALALVVQSFAVFSPPEAANASSNADFVGGGVSNVQEFLRYYDRNHKGIKSIFNSIGITRAEIASAKPTVIGESSRYNWSMTSLYSHAQGQRSWDYGRGTVFYRPMRLTEQGGNRHPVFAAYSKEMGWFAIKKDCGNLITAHPPHPPKPVAACQNLNVTTLSSTRFRFNAKASKKNGANIRAYVYTVKEGNKVVKRITANSSKLSNSVTYTRTAPGTYHVFLTVKTSTGDKTDPNCRGKFTVASKPAALCKAVAVTVSDRTLVSMSGSATTVNGAKVKQYQFVVRDASGKVVHRELVDSSRLSVSADSFTLAKPGKYSVTLSVDTSVGIVRDDRDCVKNFTIVKKEVCPYNPELPPNSPDCQPCPENPEIWIKDEDCDSEIINTKTATNLTQGNISASTKAARAGDRIRYTITVENQGLVSDNVTFKEQLHDVLEYAQLVDSGGGVFDKESEVLQWPEVNIKGGEKESRTFIVRIKEQIPLTNTGTSDEASYDCVMTNTFGNSVEVPVGCAPEKEIIEQTVSELPHTGPRENLIFAGIVLAVVVYFYARARQLGKEVRLVRRNVNAGTI